MEWSPATRPFPEGRVAGFADADPQAPEKAAQAAGEANARALGQHTPDDDPATGEPPKQSPPPGGVKT